MPRPSATVTTRWPAKVVYDHPFQFGSKRTGPDLARVGGRYSDEWHRVHLVNPRDVVPESNMPAYPWLTEDHVNEGETGSKMRALRSVGVPYTDEDIAGAADAVRGKTEMEALVAYLQGLGTARPTGERWTSIYFAASSPASLLVLFISLVVWAWSKRRRADFDAAARLPLEDEGPAP